MPSSYVIREHFEKLIKGQLQQGRYASTNEVIRVGLRALDDLEKLRALKLQDIRVDIQQVINSGPGRPVQAVIAELSCKPATSTGTTRVQPLMRCELLAHSQRIAEHPDAYPARPELSSALRHLLYGQPCAG
jgi:antitoxin ParD1/3/4